MVAESIVESSAHRSETTAPRHASVGSTIKRLMRGSTTIPEGGWRRENDLLKTAEWGANRSPIVPKTDFSTATEEKPKCFRGAERDRTVGLLNAIEALSQLSYS